MNVLSVGITSGNSKKNKKQQIKCTIVSYILLFFLIFFSFIAIAKEPILEVDYTLPYHSHLATEPVMQIAEAATKLHALEQTRSMFTSNLAVKLAFRTKEQQLALASAMYYVSIHDRVVLDGPKLTIKAKVYPSSEKILDEHIRQLLHQQDHLQLRLLAMSQFEQYVNEGVELLNQAHTCSSNDIHCNYNDSILSKVKLTSNRIKALELFLVELNNFEHGWANPEKSVLTFSEATSLDPDNSLLWLAVGECLVLLNRPYESIKALQKVMTKNTIPARALYIRGIAHLQMYLPALAIKDISQALQLEPDHPGWWRALGTARLVAGDTITMCADFYQACAMGDCEGLAEVREQNFCLEPPNI